MINVVAAVIKDENGKILITQRNLKNSRRIIGISMRKDRTK